MLFSTAAPAQDGRVEELEQKLKDRDMVILELLERVEALERRVGVRRVTSQDDVQSSQVTKKRSSSAPGRKLMSRQVKHLEKSLYRKEMLNALSNAH